MKTKITSSFFAVLCLSVWALPQVSVGTSTQVARAEDERRYDKTLEDLTKSPSEQIRIRAALAAGRIGDEQAVPALVSLLENDNSEKVRAMAAFAIGEIESLDARDAILKTLRAPRTPDSIRARAVETAGKIAASNAKDERSKDLGKAILDTLESEHAKGTGKQSRDVALLALTAALRARPENADAAVAKFLASADARVRADAANALARIRAKNANETLRAMLKSDADPIARANAARALGAAEDKAAVDLLLLAATEDNDPRVRVSAVRALASVRDPRAAGTLLGRGEKLLGDYKRSKFANPIEKNELLEIVSALGRLAADADDDRERAVGLIRSFRTADKARSPETEIAFARIAPSAYVNSFLPTSDWRTLSAQYQGLAEIARIDAKTATEAKLKARLILIQEIAGRFNSATVNDDTLKSRPDLVRAFAAFKSENTSNILRPLLDGEKDVFTRAAIAATLAEQPSTKENVDALRLAFTRSLATDKDHNDAQLAMLDAIFKLDKNAAVGAVREALDYQDHLVRAKALALLRDKDAWKDIPQDAMREVNTAASSGHGTVWPYDPKSGTKLGQVLNGNADYRRAVSRKNGQVRAIVSTEKGTFTIDLLPEAAPLTVDNFINLARANYFNGLEVHRVVPNFVMQDGDPRGDGNGGPGWSIRCEINMVPYERGMVGMALSGKDTGGSQWFATHSPQPHLDGGYTVFGRVNESGMKVVDNIVRGDKIISVKVVESRLPQKSARVAK